MKRIYIISVFLLFSIFVNTGAFSATQATCGIPAANDDMLTKRKCVQAYSEGMGLYCKQTTCNSAIKIEMTLNFAVPPLTDIKIDIDGKDCKIEGLTDTCSTFAGEIVSNLFEIHSAQATRARKACNFAKAKFNSAQECFNHVLASQNTAGMTGFFDTSKLNKVDEGIEKLCGRNAIIERYKVISSIDPWDEADAVLFFNADTNAVSGKVGTGANKKLSSSVATSFANIGNANWNITGKVGNFLDLKLDLKTASYPRELITLVNSFITGGETACGSSFRTEMQDTSFELADNRSSLEKEIAKKGLLKGLYDYGLNQASVIIGEDKAQDLRDKGIVGSIQESINKKKNEQLYDNKEDTTTIEDLSTGCEGSPPTTHKEIKPELDSIFTKLTIALNEIEGKSNRDVQDSFARNYPMIRKTANSIITNFTAIPPPKPLEEYSTIRELNATKARGIITEVRRQIRTLSSTTWTCPNEVIAPPPLEEDDISYLVGNGRDIDWSNIDTAKNLFKSDAILSITKENAENWGAIEDIVDEMITNFPASPE